METYSTRQNKVSRLIQKEISDIFMKEAKHLCLGRMVTVTMVRVSPDLGLAKIYISVYPSTQGKETITTIKAEQKIVRTELGKRVRHQLRIVPELAWYLDDSLDYVDKINILLKK